MICPGCHLPNADTNRFCQRCFRLLKVGDKPVGNELTLPAPRGPTFYATLRRLFRM